MEKRYYLNNMSDSVVTITLSTKRTITILETKAIIFTSVLPTKM